MHSYELPPQAIGAPLAATNVAGHDDGDIVGQSDGNSAASSGERDIATTQP
jgi:hypothetical protein